MAQLSPSLLIVIVASLHVLCFVFDNSCRTIVEMLIVIVVLPPSIIRRVATQAEIITQTYTSDNNTIIDLRFIVIIVINKQTLMFKLCHD